jgi:hypothetical protein
MPYTQNSWSGSGYWYLDYMGTTTRWVAEDRMIITLNLTIREDAPTGPTYVGLQHTFVWWYNYWVDRTTFFDDRIDDVNDPSYRMMLMVTGGLPGDFDSDGDVDTDDIDLLCDNLGDASYDLDGDGDADEDDMIFLIQELVELTDGSGRVGTEVGDFNLDGLINATDLAIMSPNFGTTGMNYGDGNANCDELINATDLAVLAGNFGYIAPAGAVPEPITMSLLGAGGLALLRRRSR